MGAKKKVNQRRSKKTGGDGGSQESSLNQTVTTNASAQQPEQITQIKEIVNQLENMLDIQFQQICQGIDADFENSKAQLSMEDQKMTIDQFFQSGKKMMDLPITVEAIDSIFNKNQTSNKENINQTEEKQTFCTEQMLEEIQTPKSNRRLSKTKITPSKISNDCSNQKGIKISSENNNSNTNISGYINHQFKNKRGSVVGMCQIRDNMSVEEKEVVYEQLWGLLNGRKKIL